MPANEFEFSTLISQYLSKYSFIYNFKWTEIDKEKPWIHFSKYWLNYFENYNLENFKSLMKSKIPIPDFLTDFIKFPNEINSIINKFKHELCQPMKSMTPKKSHELLNIANFIDLNLYNSDSEFEVVDVGSGVGNLSRYLTARFDNCKILAVEGSEELNSLNKTNSKTEKIHFYINEDNLDELQQTIDSKLENASLLTGLHCCGSLSSLLLSLFTCDNSISNLLLFSCCYHRMAHPNTEDKITGFPLSQFYKDNHGDFIEKHVNYYFLRLACQETKYTYLLWIEDDYFHHKYTVGFRCILNKCIEQFPDQSFNFLKRIRFNKKNSSTMTFSEFIQPALDKLADYPIEIREYLVGQISSIQNQLHWFSVMLALQQILQESLEIFILLDRLIYLKECPLISHASIVQIFDPVISPRAFALVAKKAV